MRHREFCSPLIAKSIYFDHAAVVVGPVSHVLYYFLSNPKVWTLLSLENVVKIEHGRSFPGVFCFKAEQARETVEPEACKEEKRTMNPQDQGDILEAGSFFVCLSLFSASPSLGCKCPSQPAANPRKS